MSGVERHTQELLGEGWWRLLGPEFKKPYFQDLKRFLKEEKQRHTIFPKGSDIFNAFHCTPLERVRVVILGQDPYHGPGQAHGLCFSVRDGIPHPPSLRNILTELASDLGSGSRGHGDLSPWAAQGVLLLNTTLTVRSGEAASHQNKGWERFTAVALNGLAQYRKGLVFLLWGSHAQRAASDIDPDIHYLLKAPHPSPLSAHRGFFGCRHFSSTNEILAAQGVPPIDWSL
ncbi:MAG: uracil-DNA glycosylase [Flavobacteriales bacterium]|nr:uracil-DNA glycosylase [Flavobacteriales bacterium]